MPETKEVVRKFGDEEIKVLYRKSRPAGAGDTRDSHPPLFPSTTVENGIRLERDVSVPMRDGVIIYVDIYRPDGVTNVPSIIGWTPYGKRNHAISTQWQSLVKDGIVSPMAKFECPDPAHWCPRGYAIINPDPRGVGFSQGDCAYLGTQEGRDGHDLIEWIAAQGWSSGKVGMAGNSWAAMCQWYIAAEKPPHLVCIAPWEGTSDIYRELMCWGGIPEVGFNGMLVGDVLTIGPGYAEDYVNMARRFPLMNAYWDDKVPHFENIEIPVYATLGWCHFHLRGATEAFQSIASRDKWLRCHRDFEWIDDFYPENLADLQLFFDHYLKGVPNSWPLTPRVRLDVMDAGEIDYQHWRPEKEFPLARTSYEKLFLDGKTGRLTRAPVADESLVSYEAEVNHEVQPVSYDAMSGHMANFSMAFEEETELTGYMNLKLWVEADGADDMDLWVTVQKLDETGNQIPVRYQAGDSVSYAHPGVPGKLRVSLRELDEKRSRPYKPFRNYRHRQVLKPKEIVPVDIEIWPTSMIWHAGQQIRVVVSGYYFREKGWWEAAAFTWETINRGKHIIHTGGKCDSHLLVPVIPPRYATRTYTYR